jgi:osmoprotectant transport system substrate-binding protein
LIGTSAYRKEFPPLPAAANSLKGLEEILVDSQLCRWPADRVTTFLNPRNAGRLIISFRRLARETEDVLLVYYVGHGTITQRGELCLAVSDTEFDDPDVTGIEYGRVRDALLDSPARIKVVILDCCYSGRAIQALAAAADISGITDIRGAYTITASDQAAHVPALPLQTRACTSFTGELLDLIRTGIPGGPETLTLNMLYCQLRARLRQRQLPAPNQRGTDTAAEFGFSRNAALLPGPIERFPRPPAPPGTRRPWRTALIAAAAGLAASAVFIVARPGTPSAKADAAACGSPAPAARSARAGGRPDQKGTVVVGSADFTESEIIGQIYVDALQAKGIKVKAEFCLGAREVYYPLVRAGWITVMPEYNGALLTTSVDPGSKAVSTSQVDAALNRYLPPSLAILAPSPAQDQDSVTVTRATAVKYHLSSIAGLSRVEGGMVIGGPPEYPDRQQGLIGLKADYGVIFNSFQPLDDSGPLTIAALNSGEVQAADVFTTDPFIKADNLVALADPRHLFTADNVVPLVYRPGVNPLVISTLNAVSVRLTTSGLRDLVVEAEIDGRSIAAVARGWLRHTGLS